MSDPRPANTPGVRPVVPSDRAEWLRMRQALWPDEAPEDLEDLDEALGLGEVPAAVFVWDRGNAGLGGLVEVGLRSVAEGCYTHPVGYLEGWYVDPDLRRTGVGAALVAAAEGWARAQGCREMASDTWLDNTLSQQAHARLGYQEVERLVHFRKSLDE
jgi:aminoglycoside 6'-N-acetyltransferase I